MTNRSLTTRTASTALPAFHTAAHGELSTELPMAAWTAVDFETAEVLAATASTVNAGPTPLPTLAGEVRLCADCGTNVAPGESFSRERCEHCYERHIYALKKAGTFTRRDTSRPLLDRLLDKAIAGPGGCIIWTGALNGTHGYGSISKGRKAGRRLATHRVAYELMVGPIPDGMHIDHTCHNRDASCPGGPCLHRRCINPHHLEAVPQAENTRRSPVGTASRTHCPQGHAYDEANTIRTANGWRKCRTCENARHRARTARRAAEGVAQSGDSDPNPDEALRRVQGRPARANIDTLIARIGQWHQEQVDAAYAERDEQLDASVAYELTLAGWSA